METINKILTNGITADLFSEYEKGEILDDFRNRINKSDGKIIEWYVFIVVLGVVDVIVVYSYDKAEEREWEEWKQSHEFLI